MKTAIADMDERPSAFDRVDRFRAPADDRWAVPVRRSVRRAPELPRPRREHLLRLLEPRRRHDWALLAAIRDAYVTGGATRRVEALARVLGVDGLNDEDVVHAAHELDRRLLTFRSRPLVAVYPYLVIDAIGQNVRERGRVQRLAVIVVVGVAATGMREILAIEIDDPEQPATWSRLLRGLRDRGVYGVRLVTADAFPGITPAIAEVFVGASFQRSRSRLIRDVAAQVAEGDRPTLSAQLRTVFRQDDRIAAQSRLRRIPEAFGLNPTLVQQLHEWEDSILACYDLPPRHRGRVNAASCLSAARREIEGHCQVIGIFPNRLSLLRLSGVMLEEHNDEWLAGPRYVGRRADHDPAVKPGGAGALHAGGVAARTLLRVVQAA